MMKPVLMVNDLGGIVYVGKNELCLRFLSGVEHTLRVETTKKLIDLIESRSSEPWEDDKFTIEPIYIDPHTRERLTIITVKHTEEDEDKATVLQTELWEALMEVEYYISSFGIFSLIPL